MYQQQRICQICEKVKSKYKCPNCCIQYCSLICFKKHKQQTINKTSICSAIKKDIIAPEQHQESRNAESAHQELGENQYVNQNQLIKTDYIEDQSLRIPHEQLQKLSKNEKIIGMLKSKEIRAKILQIDNSRMRLNVLQKALLDQQFMQFANEALQTVGKAPTRN